MQLRHVLKEEEGYPNELGPLVDEIEELSERDVDDMRGLFVSQQYFFSKATAPPNGFQLSHKPKLTAAFHSSQPKTLFFFTATAQPKAP